MKNKYLTIVSILLIFVLILMGCGASKEALTITEDEKAAFKQTEGDTIHIANAETEYEIIIIEPGFNIWLQSIARPEGYYSQSFLEGRNQVLVLNWNQRVMEPQRFNFDLYQLQIDYQSNIDYGYEVNYKLYNYFVYFQRKYRQRLGPFLPRI